MTIKVLHIIGSLHLGGAQVCLKQLVEHNQDPEIEHFVYPLRSRQIDIPIRGQVVTRPFANYDPRKLLTIVSLCRRHRIDVIHAHLHKAIIAALLLRFFLNIPVVVHEHGPIARRGFQYSLYRLLLRLLKRKASRFIAVSKAVAGQLTQFAGVDPQQIEVVYNAVDTTAFSPDAAQRACWREYLNAGSTTTVIGCAGRLAWEKGPDILLEAFAILLERNADALLVFVGDGCMKDTLRQRAGELEIEGKVRFLGFRSNVGEIMNAFDIGCVPSRQEGFGIAAIELMSMRVPLVSSSVYGLAEIVSNGRNALVPEQNTPEQICGCLVRLIEDPDLGVRLANNARVDVQKFGIENLVSRVNDIYRRVCDTKEHTW